MLSDASMCLGLATFIRHHFDFLTSFGSRLKTYFFRLAFDCSVNVLPRYILANAPEVATLWRYINQFIIIIIIIRIKWLIDCSDGVKDKDSTLKAKTKDFKIVLEDPRGRGLVLEDCNTGKRRIKSLSS